MRDFTESELTRLSKGLCPACGERHKGYTTGPTGGMMMNIEMPCGSKMNVVDPEAGWPPFLVVGQMLDDTPTFNEVSLASKVSSWFSNLLKRY